jgi:hypothetical protein
VDWLASMTDGAELDYELFAGLVTEDLRLGRHPELAYQEPVIGQHAPRVPPIAENVFRHDPSPPTSGWSQDARAGSPATCCLFDPTPRSPAGPVGSFQLVECAV